jgi:hypothetical protein
VVPIDASPLDHPIHRTVRFSHQVEATCLLFLAGLITTSIGAENDVDYSTNFVQWSSSTVSSQWNRFRPQCLPPRFLAFKSICFWKIASTVLYSKFV